MIDFGGFMLLKDNRYRFWILFIPLILIGHSIIAQKEQPEEVFEQVLKILTDDEASLPQNQSDLIQKSAWEALTYIEEGKESYNREDLLEAVPDYYNFKSSTVIIKLIDPNDYNVYGIEVEVNYSILNGKVLLKDDKGTEKDNWKILYLDENYMAMDMGELRVFFTKTPIQE